MRQIYALASLLIVSAGLATAAILVTNRQSLTTNAWNPGIACNESGVIMTVSPATVNQNVTFTLSGADSSTWIEDYWSGGVNCSGAFWPSKTCTSTSAGQFTWTHKWRVCSGSTDNCSEQLCTKSASFAIAALPATPTPTRTPTPIPPQCGAGSTCVTFTTNCQAVGRVNGSGNCTNGVCCAAAFTPTPVKPSPTKTPTPSPTSQPSTSGTNACGGTCGSNSNCNSNLFCFNGFCRNPLCGDSLDCVCKAPTSTKTPTPKAATTPKPTATPKPGVPTSTPTITPKPTTNSTPTPQPTILLTKPETCIQPCSSNDACDPALICFSGYCRNPLCITNTNCSCGPENIPTLSPTSTPKPQVTVTPKGPTNSSGGLLLFLILLFIIILIIFIIYRRRRYTIPPTLAQKYQSKDVPPVTHDKS